MPEPNEPMDLDQAAKACTPRTAAIVPVHLYGQMVDMIELRALANRPADAVITMIS